MLTMMEIRYKLYVSLSTNAKANIGRSNPICTRKLCGRDRGAMYSGSMKQTITHTRAFKGNLITKFTYTIIVRDNHEYAQASLEKDFMRGCQWYTSSVRLTGPTKSLEFLPES